MKEFIVICIFIVCNIILLFNAIFSKNKAYGMVTFGESCIVTGVVMIVLLLSKILECLI